MIPNPVKFVILYTYNPIPAVHGKIYTLQESFFPGVDNNQRHETTVWEPTGLVCTIGQEDSVLFVESNIFSDVKGLFLNVCFPPYRIRSGVYPVPCPGIKASCSTALGSALLPHAGLPRS